MWYELLVYQQLDFGCLSEQTILWVMHYLRDNSLGTLFCVNSLKWE